MSECQSRTMPIETGTYCQHCANESGQLIAFEEVFVRMVQWNRKEHPDLDATEVEAQTLQFMSQRAAWKDDPTLLAKLGS